MVLHNLEINQPSSAVHPMVETYLNSGGRKLGNVYKGYALFDENVPKFDLPRGKNAEPDLLEERWLIQAYHDKKLGYQARKQLMFTKDHAQRLSPKVVFLLDTKKSKAGERILGSPCPIPVGWELGPEGSEELMRPIVWADPEAGELGAKCDGLLGTIWED
ncbi:hypothetical protein Cgig2_001951 [Carnegiea gigantea]|uniref:Uncharacterized protein n=1 Tax=Carnegiea gigantea TaxID=171969 RepID=A0A9Q1K1K1_9CARY|nr:hypothetical protein Cgig2_001951 [Carnegiea gigantea]